MRLIDADALSKAMYESAFEKDSDEQKWDSGCWIRYKMFERNISNVPTIDAVPVVRCKDCQFYDEGENDVDSWMYCKLHSMDTQPDNYCSRAVHLGNSEQGEGHDTI